MVDLVEWSPPSSPDGEPSPDEVLKRRLPELQALQPHQLLTINLDVPTLVANAFGALPAIHLHLPEFQRALSEFDPASLAAKLEDYAIILNSVDADYRAATRRERCPREIIQEARALRGLLLSSLTTFAHRGLVDRRKWKRLEGTSGHVNLAADLGMLVKVFEQTPVLLRDYSIVTQRDLDRARELARRILTYVGQRCLTPEELEAAAELRVRAFTLLVNVYQAIRRMALFLRWERNEGDKLVPSLFNQHRTRRRRAKLMERQAAVATEVTLPTAMPQEVAAPPNSDAAKLN